MKKQIIASFGFAIVIGTLGVSLVLLLEWCSFVWLANHTIENHDKPAQCDVVLQERAVYLTDKAVSVTLGGSAVCYRLDGSVLSVWNDDDASGRTSDIQVSIPVKEGEEVLPEEWQVEDGHVVIFVDGLVPGGSKKIDLSGVIDRLDTDHIVVTSDDSNVESEM